MIARKFFTSFVLLSLCNCGALSESGPSGSYVAAGLIGAASGAGIGAAIGSAINNGDVAQSAYLGAGVGLAVGVVGSYAYKEIKEHNHIIDNQEQIEENRQDILTMQSDLDKMREEALAEASSIDFDDSKTGKVYEGASLGVYYR